MIKNRPQCSYCGGAAKYKGKNKNGSRKYGKICGECQKQKWRKYRKSKCDLCGFIPIHMCQLDVDHIDGDKKNNKPENLQTLCSNCHRLKSWMNGDYFSEKTEPASRRQSALF